MSELQNNSNQGNLNQNLPDNATNQSQSRLINMSNQDNKPQSASMPASTPAQSGAIGTSSQPSMPRLNTAPDGSNISQSQDFFAEQNHRIAEKKAKTKKNLTIAVLIIASVMVLVAAGLAVWAVISASNQEPEQTFMVDDISNLQNVFNELYNGNDTNNDNNIEAVEQKYQEVLATSVGQEYIDRVKMQKIYFYNDNALYDSVIAFSKGINEEKLSQEEKANFYNMMYTAYLMTGKRQEANEYSLKSFKLLQEINGIAENPDNTEGNVE